MKPDPYLGTEADVPEIEGGSRRSEDDPDAGSPAGGDSDDEADRSRPGEYPESDESDEDRDLDTVEEDEAEEDEDLDEEEDDEDEFEDEDEDDAELRRGRDPKRTWKSIAREERRRRSAAERRTSRILEQLAENQNQLTQILTSGQPRNGAEAVPAEPPTTKAAIVALMEEGKFREAADAQEQLDDWKRARDMEAFSRQSKRAASIQKLDAIISQGLDFSGNKPYARAVRDKARELRAQVAELPEDQANLVAAALVNAGGFRRKSREDARDESRRREESRRRQVRAGSSSFSRGAETQGKPLKLSREVRAGLERFGMLEEYMDLAKSKDGRAKLRERLKRVERRLAETKAQARVGG